MSAREVTLLGGSPWGFRMHGGHDLHQALRISRVNPGSKAAQQGVREGDLISSINGRSTRDLTNSEAHALLRNAGEHLKLGLNQESIGSPKRRIYKSSLQENTTTEISNKTTTKTTSTSNSRIITTETKKNGTNDTKLEKSYANQNGGPKGALTEVRGEIRKRFCEFSEYATDTEEIAMPHGTRNRRNRRGRNKRRFPQQPNPEKSRNPEEIPNSEETSTVKTSDSALGNVEEKSVDDVSFKENTVDDDLSEEKAVDDLSEEKPVHCVTFKEKLVEDEIIQKEIQETQNETLRTKSILKSRKEEKCRIEKGSVQPGIKIVQITTVSSLPLEAKIDHIPGVGILETACSTGKTINDASPMVTISEPVESIKPFPDCKKFKVQIFGSELVPVTKPVTEDRDGVRICDVSDCDVETDSIKPLITEMESDVEREATSEESATPFDTDHEESDVGHSAIEGTSHAWDTVMPREVERRLRTFIEGLRLPSYSEDVRESNRSTELETIGGGLVQKKIRKRAALESYHAHSQAANRFLDIIQEEGEKLSEDEEQHIRDFINEEIGKYRREERRWQRRSIRDSGEGEESDDRIANEQRGVAVNDADAYVADVINDNNSEREGERVDRNEGKGEKLAEAEENSGAGNCDRKSIFLDGVDREGKSARIDATEETNETLEEEESELITINASDANEASVSDANNNEREVTDPTGEANRVSNERLNENDVANKEEPSSELLKEDRCYERNSELPPEIPTPPNEQRRPPTPPRRSSSRADVNSPGRANSRPRPLELDDDLPVPPIRRRREANLVNDTDVPPNRPPLPKRSVAEVEPPGVPSVNVAVIDVSRAASTVDDTSANVDLSVRGIPKIVDDPRERDTGARFESDSTIGLRNYVETGAGLGNEAGPEITRDYLGRKMLEKCSVDKSTTTSSANGLPERIVKVEKESSAEMNDKKETFDRGRSGEESKDTEDEDRWKESFRCETSYKKIVKEETSSVTTIETEKNIRTIAVGKENEDKLESSKESTSRSTREEEFLETRDYPASREDREVKSFVFKSTTGDKVDAQNESGKHRASDSALESRDVELDKEKSKSEIIDFQGQDSSSGTASVSTVKYNPVESWQTDIYSIIEEEARKNEEINKGGREIETPTLRSKLSSLRNESNVNDANGREDTDTPEPIPYSPVEDLFYVPLDSCENPRINNEFQEASITGPESLKDLCIKKIFSMPYGLRILNEITVPKFNIFKSLRSIPKFSNDVGSSEKLASCKEKLSGTDACKNLFQGRQDKDRSCFEGEIGRDDPEGWVGLSTSKDPKLLLCLSPSQQKTAIRTSADNLLDLHKKFLNRHSYREHEPQRVPVPKYKVEVRQQPTETDGLPRSHGEMENRNRHVGRASNRLLEIIKENSISPVDDSLSSKRSNRSAPIEAGATLGTPGDADSKTPRGKSGALDGGQERLKVTRLCDWLNLARRQPVDIPCHATLDLADDLLAETSGEEERHDKTTRSTVDARIHDSRSAVTKESTRVVNTEPGVDRSVHRPGRYANSAIIVDTTDRPDPPARSGTPFGRSPITLNSAIIDKSPSAPDAGKKTPTRRNVDPRYNVNPALIDDRVEVPPRMKRVVNVDKSCIDTTSIFYQNPPRSHLEPRKYKDAEDLKQVAATEIMENLKKIQSEASTRSGGRRKYSLPQEYFSEQLKYIELLENQLENVLLAEEEEREAFEDFKSHAFQRLEERRDESRSAATGDASGKMEFGTREDGFKNTSGENDSRVESESWDEKSRKAEENHSETIDKHGRRDFEKKVRRENGVHEEETREKIERVESSVITRKEKKIQESKEEKEIGKADVGGSRLTSDKTRVSDKDAKTGKPGASAVAINGEVFRRQMYDEYVHKVLEREERKHHKVVKISAHEDILRSRKKSEDGMTAVEKEFIEKARSRLNKFGINLDGSESENDNKSEETNGERGGGEKAKCLIDGKEFEDAGKLPRHLQEFLKISATCPEDGSDNNYAARGKGKGSDLLHEIDRALKIGKGFLFGQGVWSPGSEPPAPPPPPQQSSPDRKESQKDGGIPPVWTPSSAGASPVPEKKEFRPVQFESPVLSRKKLNQEQGTGQEAPPPWNNERERKEIAQSVYESSASRIVNSHSAPTEGLNALTSAPRLPRAQNPTITLLQKAREGQLPKGAAYLEENATIQRLPSDDKPLISPGEIIYTVKKEYESEPETDTEPPKKMADLGPRKFEGIGPMTKEGVPLVLRSEVKENNQTKWYKKMYDSLHRADKNDDYVTIRYKPRRGTRYGYGSGSGYLSEPEPRIYSERSATLDTRRRFRNKENDFTTSTMPRKNGALKYSPEVYKNQPGRIEDYEPGRSSIAEKEAKEWWDEVMDIFDGWLTENGRPQGSELDDLRDGQLSHRALSLSYRPESNHSVRVSAVSSSNAQTLRVAPKSQSRSALAEDEGCRLDVRDSKGLPRPKQQQQQQQQQLWSSSHLLDRSRLSYLDRPGDRSRACYLDRPGDRSGDRPRDHSGLSGYHDWSSGDRAIDAERPINRIARPLERIADCGLHAGMLEGRSKSFVLPDRCFRRSSSPIAARSTVVAVGGSTLLRGAGDPVDEQHRHRHDHHRHHHHHHHHHHRHQHHQRASPTSSSSTSSSISSTNHIMLPSPSPTAPPVITANAQPSSASRPFDQRNTRAAKPYMTQALKESGYESDSTLVFRRREDISPLSQFEQKLAYKTVQSGGDVPLHGFRKPAPERPKDDSGIEYFPISPTLTRIRVHRKSAVTSATTSSSSPMIFSRYKRSVPSLASSIVPTSSARKMEIRPTVPVKSNSSLGEPRGRTPCVAVSSQRPPSPPRRRSSRNSRTLQLYSKQRTPENAQFSRSRHEQCFAADNVSNIRSLRERFCSNLERYRRNREIAQQSSITTSGSISSRSRTTATTFNGLSKKKSEPCLSQSFPATSVERNVNLSAQRGRTRVSTSASPSWRVNGEFPTKSDSKRASDDKSSIAKVASRCNVASSTRSSRCFTDSGANLRSEAPGALSLRKEGPRVRLTRREQEESSKRLSKSSADLTYLTENRRVLEKFRDKESKETRTRILPTGTVVKSSTALYASTLNSGKPSEALDKSLKVVVAISSKGQEILRKSTETTKASSETTSPSVIRKSVLADIKKPRTIKRPDKTIVHKEPSRSTMSSSSEAIGESNKRKRLREKPQTILRTPARKPETIRVNPEVSRKRAEAKKKVRKDKNGESSRARRSTNEQRKGESGNPERENIENEEPNAGRKRRENRIPALTVEELQRHREATRSDTFFQNLFLRSIPSPTPTGMSDLKRSIVYERARIYQENARESSRSEPSLKSLSVYLSQKRPVSNSRFKNSERESVSSRSSSPYGVCWPGRSIFQKVSKFDSLLGINEFGSTATLRLRSPDSGWEHEKGRSSSEPPLKILPEGGRQSSSRASSPSPIRSPACRRIRSLRQDRSDAGEPIAAKKVRARSAGDAEDARSRFGSTLSLTRSASSLCPSPIDRDEYHRYVTDLLRCRSRSNRYKELQDFYSSLERMGELERTFSSTDLRPRARNEEIIDYDRWKRVRRQEKAEIELNAIYGKLRAVQRDKDFLFSPKDVDKFKWHGDCGLRCKERSVENILQHFQKLQKQESELEASRRRDISSRKDTYKPLWRGTSVVNVANAMQRRANNERENERSFEQPPVQRTLGGSKKFWSSLSIEQVATLKKQLNEIYGENAHRSTPSTSSRVESEIAESPREETKSATGSKRESLSGYEILVPPLSGSSDPRDDGKGLHVRCHSMIAPAASVTSGDRTPISERFESTLRRSDSIGRGKSLLERSESDKTTPTTPPMSEFEKKRLSLTLGKEVLDKVTERRSSTSLAPRETRGSIAAASAAKKIPSTFRASATSPGSCHSLETSRTEESSRSKEKNDFLLILTPTAKSPADERRVETALERWSRKPPLLAITLPEDNRSAETKTVTLNSGSERDSTTGSSETSVRTIVERCIDTEDVARKIEMFENAEKKDSRRERDYARERRSMTGRLSSSQSFADLKELFGESDSARYATLPLSGCRASGRKGSPERKADNGTRQSSFRSCSRDRERDRPHSVSPCRAATRSNSSCSSERSFLWPRRNSSPDPERYWHAYLKLARNGSVRKLRARFESAEDLSEGRSRVVPAPKRFRSDPELARSLLRRVEEGKRSEVFREPRQGSTDVAWLRGKYESSATRKERPRRRGESPPIPRVPLRREDLSMPRIDVISKTAELKSPPPPAGRNFANAVARRAETRELEAKKPVERMRRKFERSGETSILGEMFTSSPDVHELRDIGPYLAGQWVAHRYPSRRDNTRSLSSPPDLGKQRSSSASSSCPRDPIVAGTSKTSISDGRKKKKADKPLAVPPSRAASSILKQSEGFANQPFDPDKHRPRFRYQPPPPPPSPIARRKSTPWWSPIPIYTARPTVTFEGLNLQDC